MADDDILTLVSQTPDVRLLQRTLESEKEVFAHGVNRSAQPLFAALLHRLFPERSIVVVTNGVKTQEGFQQDIETWLRLGQAKEAQAPNRISKAAQVTSSASDIRPLISLFYPAWETLPHEAKLPHADIISERLETLVALSCPAVPGAKAAPVVVTTVTALMQRTFPAGLIKEKTRTLARGDQIDPLDLIEWLEDQGYESEAQVTQKGEIALRGGILDVYPLISPWPVRLEFFGDQLESLRFFDPNTQMSREPIDMVTLPPGGEIVMLKQIIESQDTGRGADRSQTGTQSRDSETAVRTAFTLGSFIDYLPPKSIFILCDPDELSQHADVYSEQIPDNDPFFLDWTEVLAQLKTKEMTVMAVSEEESPSDEPTLTEAPDTTTTDFSHGSRITHHVKLPFSSLDAFRPLGERSPEPQIAEAQRREFFHQLHRWLRQDYAVHVYCNNDGERQRFGELWQEYGLGEILPSGRPGPESHPNSPFPIPNSQLTAHLGTLARGFICEPAKVIVITDAEIFGRYKVQRPRRLKSPHAAAVRSAFDIDFTHLEEGDYVVHLQHGIGRYLGLKVLPMGLGRKPVHQAAESAASEQECLVIEYAAGDADQLAPKLYVPVTEAHLVSKYVGTGKARPALNTLGGTRWAKAKAQAEEAVRDLASELLAMQAARESQAGHAFATDTPWQREFESAFLFEETPDQMRSILETKKDMETTKPMDRLICGDVGYGKTEVAIRAAFKAVMDGRQVALLVPTTILAQQHFNTFRERMADYPVRVEQLSRFRTRREQNRIVQQLAEGSVDIVIGTHRLLQDDIAFKDLGLVVIDEEQRFGVLHKEKLKLLRKLVDVLTLSATPIPRTLYLALTGARDMSTIETPPQDRLPVETIVAQYDERLIRDAIQRELNREGQVYYLHNRVHDIESVALRIRSLIPKARVMVGHGQMESDELEEVMASFINGQADVLVSTTIIESGIDIPNANTIIIDRADRFGLSDLYQLRGRVGRYKHQAYAYLLLPRHAALLSDVRKRISAIRQYSSLGSGFKIAMRDLEIRGAGNLLGPEQSGHITAVGFDLYCQLLKQSVSALKGEKVKPRVEVQLRLDFLALNPGEEQRPLQQAGTGSQRPEARKRKSELEINVPREVASYVERSDTDLKPPVSNLKSSLKAAAYIPFRYIPEAQHRIDIYRKLAQVSDKSSLEGLRNELRDRFGKMPAAIELLLQVAELKYLASERGVTSIETKEEKLMLMRNKDYITLDGKFPRLAKKEAKPRLSEIKKLLLAL
jgi:transcription-repair coupling factor (superfamily II helicase)